MVRGIGNEKNAETQEDYDLQFVVRNGKINDMPEGRGSRIDGRTNQRSVFALCR